jgi:predicted ATPase
MAGQQPDPTGNLLGRKAELARLQHALERVSEGGSAFLITGEPGIGKTVLLTEAQRRAKELGMQVLRTTGATSESHLPYAGLHRLLRALLASNDHHNEAQRAVVMSALGLNGQQPPEAFRTALAALDLLVDAAAGKPLLIVAEDAHWLDRPTWDVLTFIGRRLEDDPVVLLASSRDGPDEQDILAAAMDLDRLQLVGLTDADAAKLLDDRAPELAPAVRARVLREAAGNPLAIVELPIAVSQLGDDAAQRSWLPLTTRLEQAFAARMSGLAAATRTLLLVTALNEDDTIDQILLAGRAVVGSELTLEDLVPAIDARLIVADGSTVRFRHPLVRSAVAEGATLAEQHAVHQALAALLPAGTDRHVWHRAASTTGPNESLAADLEAAANRALRRGAVVTAQVAFEDAARLSETPQRQGARLLKAAGAALQLGRRDALQPAARRSVDHPLSPAQRTQLAWWRETSLTTSWSGAGQIPNFVAIADEMRRQR